MSTFSEIKADIADEVNRTDLTTQIEKSILRAITFYQSDRFWFSEERSEGQTEIGEPYYPLPQDFVKAISFSIVKDKRNYPLRPRTIDVIHSNADGNITDTPIFYSIIDEQIRVYPIPNEALQLILIYYKELTLPQDADDELEWTLDITEQLIRYRAKKELYFNYLHDVAMFQVCASMEAEIYAKMKERNILHVFSGHLEKEDSIINYTDETF